MSWSPDAYQYMEVYWFPIRQAVVSTDVSWYSDVDWYIGVHWSCDAYWSLDVYWPLEVYRDILVHLSLDAYRSCICLGILMCIDLLRLMCMFCLPLCSPPQTGKWWCEEWRPGAPQAGSQDAEYVLGLLRSVGINRKSGLFNTMGVQRECLA